MNRLEGVTIGEVKKMVYLSWTINLLRIKEGKEFQDESRGCGTTSTH